MRTELLCALALLCGAEAAYGQYWPANTYNNNYYNRGYSPGYSYPYGNYPNYPYGAQPRATYYPIAPAATNDQAATPRANAAVAASTQSNDNTGQTTPIEIGPVLPAAPDEITTLPPGTAPRPRLIQPPPDNNGPGRIALSEFFASLWPTIPFHRSCADGFWASGDYVQGWMRPGPLVAPVVTGGSQAASSAVLGQPNTTILYGNAIDYPTTPGVRAEIGCFVGEGNRVSVEVGGIYYAPTYSHFSAQSNSAGSPAIGRPFFDTNPVSTTFGSESAELDSLPAKIAGSTMVNSESQLWGFEANVRYHIYALGRLHMDFLGGFRFLRLTESLGVQDQSTALAPGEISFLRNGGAYLPAGSVTTDRDSFATINQFSGLNLGTRLKWEGDNYFVSVFGKAAFGCTNQNVQIEGNSTAVTPGGAIQTAQGGILALPSNIGTYSRSVFSVVPECGLTFGVDVTSHIRLTAGYSFLYWTRVARPGAEFDHQINSAQIPLDPGYNPTAGGAAHPAFQFNDNSFWVHSITCGVEFHY